MTAYFDMNVTIQNGTVLYEDFLQPPHPPGPPADPLHKFRKYAYLITCVIGILGNVIIFLIFTRTKLKKPSTSRYLAAAAVADAGFLIAVLCVHLDGDYKLRVHTAVGSCQLVRFGDHAFSFLSRWYLTAVVIEKYIGVMWPRKKSKMCTVFRAKCVIICLAIMSIVCYLYITWFFGVTGKPPQCTMYYDEQVIESWIILSKIDAIINFVVPYLIIFVLTCLVAYQSWVYHRRSTTASERFLRRRRVTRPEDKEFKTTPLLIVLATSTLLLCIPNSTIRLRQFATIRFSMELMLMMQIFHYLEVLNSSIKVFLYFISSTPFAREIGKPVCALLRVFKRSEDEERQTRHIAANMDQANKQNEVTFREGKV